MDQEKRFVELHSFTVLVDGMFHARFNNERCAAHTAADRDINGTVSGPLGDVDNERCRQIAIDMSTNWRSYSREDAN